MRKLLFFFLFFMFFLVLGSRVYAADTVTITANYDGDAEDDFSTCDTSSTDLTLEGSNGNRVFIRFPLTTLPSGALVTKAELQYSVRTAGTSASSVQGFNRNGQLNPSSYACSTRYVVSGNDTTPYLTNVNVAGSTGAKTLTLGADAQMDITNAKAAGTNFTIGINEGSSNGTTARIYSVENTDTNLKPKLVLTYTMGSTYFADFGINPSAPDCTPSDTDVVSGTTASISTGPCAPSDPVPTIVWGTPVIPTPSGPTPTGTQPASCGSISGTGSTVTYTPPTGLCGNFACSIPFTASNTTGSTNENVNVTVKPSNSISGTVYADTLNNGCTSGATPMNATLTINNGTPSVNTSGGNYTISDTNACGSRSITISNIGTYHVKGTRLDGTGGIPGGAWEDANPSYTYSFNFAEGSTSHTLDWCMSNVNPWVQTTTGNVRFSSIPYRIPAGQAASSSTTNPSVITSTGSFPWTIGEGSVSANSDSNLAKRWLVNNEFSDYNSASSGTNGGASYSFYKSRALQRNVATPEPPGCTSGTTCTATLTGLSGAYHHTGDLVISSYTHTAGNHVLLMVSGKTTINSNISVPSTCIGSQCNLFILASKGDIHVASGVGAASASTATPQLQGIFTSEGNVYADGGQCAGGTTADKRLNIEGSLIANSRKPFAANGPGSVVNNRSLCDQDPDYPSLTVAQRLDFAIQLSDFYKTSVVRWKEINP